MKSFLIFLLLLSVCATARAQDQADCYSADDSDLNRVYRMAMVSIDGQTSYPEEIRERWQNQLRDAQRGWIQFKENECEIVAYEYYPGNGGIMATQECLIDKTKKRLEELKKSYGISW